MTQTARVKPAAEGASTVRPLRRPAARKAEATDVTPVAPAAPPASRRAPADDDWESF